MLVATDVAARGIHVDGVDVVIHYDPPEDQKAYLHRSGPHRPRREERRRRHADAVEPGERDPRDPAAPGLQIPMLEIFSNDPRLADLPNFFATSELADA